MAFDPPLQLITKEGGLVRAAVVPRPGHKFVIGDFDHSQLRLAAGLSEDQALTDVFRDEQRDIYEEVGRWVGKPGDTRSLGKAVVLPTLFGAGDRRIAEKAHLGGHGIPRSRAKKLLERWKSEFPSLRSWQEAWQGVKAVESPLGRRIEPPRSAWNSVAAGVIQAVEADVLRLLLMASPALKAEFNAQVVLVVHDEVVWEVPDCAVGQFAPIVESLMRETLWLGCAPCPPSATVEVRTSWAAETAVQLPA